MSRDVLRQYLENAAADIYATRQLRLMVCVQENAQVVGTVDLFDFEPLHRRAGVGIALQQDARGQGYGAEALHLLLAYAAQTLQLHQLYCTVAINNPRSMYLFESAGFQKVGTRKDWLRTPYGWVDVLEYQKVFTSAK